MLYFTYSIVSTHLVFIWESHHYCAPCKARRQGLKLDPGLGFFFCFKLCAQTQTSINSHICASPTSTVHLDFVQIKKKKKREEEETH